MQCATATTPSIPRAAATNATSGFRRRHGRDSLTHTLASVLGSERPDCITGPRPDTGQRPATTKKCSKLRVPQIELQVVRARWKDVTWMGGRGEGRGEKEGDMSRYSSQTPVTWSI